jgi:hypothetical protein
MAASFITSQCYFKKCQFVFMSVDNANLKPLTILCKFFNKKMKNIDFIQRFFTFIDNFTIKRFSPGVKLEKI